MPPSQRGVRRGRKGDIGIEVCLAFKRGDGLNGIDVEHSKDDRAIRTARDSVPGEQYTRPGKVERNAAGSVARYRYGDSLHSTAEVDDVSVVEFMVHAHRRRWVRRQLGTDLVKQELLPVG
jgi:hypothetical protein